MRVLKRRKTTVALFTLVVLAAALISALTKTPIYEGQAQVLLRNRSTDSLFNPATGQPNDPTRAVATEIQIMKSQPVQAAARSQLGYDSTISASPVGQTDVIAVTAHSIQPKNAAAIANAWANAYIEFRRKQAVDDVLAAGSEVQRRVNDLQNQIDRAPGDQRAGLIQQQALFKQRLEQLQVDAALKTGGAQLVTSSSVPTSPVEPRPVRSGILGLVVGLLAGVGLAFLVDYLDDSIKTKEDLDAISGGVPTIGMIPAIADWKSKDAARLISVLEPKSPAAEAYRTLRTSITFLAFDSPMGAIQVTSPSAGEGKSSTVCNLAVALINAGERVILVDCDLRRPRVHKFFDLANDVGFTSVMLKEATLAEALQGVPGTDGLRVLTAGPLALNPSELLSSRQTAALMTSLRGEGDFVLVDSAPVLPVTDAMVLAGHVDATLVVCEAGRTTRKDLSRTIELLRQVDATLVGSILNGVALGSAYGYAYRYYREELPQGPRKTAGRKR